MSSSSENKAQTRRIVRITAVGLLGLERINDKQQQQQEQRNDNESNKPPSASTITLSSRLRQQQQRQRQQRQQQINETPNRSNKGKSIIGKKMISRNNNSMNNSVTTPNNANNNMTSTSCPSKPLSMYRYHKQDMLGTSWIQSRLAVGVSRTSIMFLEADYVADKNIEVEVECLVNNDAPVGVAVCTIASSDEAYANEGARVLDLPIVSMGMYNGGHDDNGYGNNASAATPSPSKRLARMFKGKTTTTTTALSDEKKQQQQQHLSHTEFKVSGEAFLRVMVELYTPGSKVERQWFERIAKVSDLQENHWNLMDDDEEYFDDLTAGSGTFTYDSRYNNSVQSFDYTFETEMTRTTKFESATDGGSTVMDDHTMESTIHSRYSRNGHGLPSIVQTISRSSNDCESLNSGTIATIGTLTKATNTKKSAAERAVDFSCMPCRMVNKKQVLYLSDSLDENDQSTIATNPHTGAVANSRSLFDADDDNGDADAAAAVPVVEGPARDRMGLDIASGAAAASVTPLRSNKQESSDNNDDSGTHVTYTLDSSSEYGDAFERRNKLSRSVANQSASAVKTKNTHRATSMPMNIFSIFQCVGSGSERLADQYEGAGCANNCTADVSAKNKSVPLILEDLTIDEDASGILETSMNSLR